MKRTYLNLVTLFLLGSATLYAENASNPLAAVNNTDIRA